MLTRRSSMAVRVVAFVLAGGIAWTAAPTFEDVTQKMGLDGLGGAAAAWGDYDNDGWVDLYVNGTLWHNEKGASFAPVKDSPLKGEADTLKT